jgi:hypothetical protein
VFFSAYLLSYTVFFSVYFEVYTMRKCTHTRSTESVFSTGVGDGEALGETEELTEDDGDKLGLLERELLGDNDGDKLTEIDGEREILLLGDALLLGDNEIELLGDAEALGESDGLLTSCL